MASSASRRCALRPTLRPRRSLRPSNLRPLNPYVHAGIQPHKRSVSGPPKLLVVQALRRSNGLRLTTAMLIATQPPTRRAARTKVPQFLDRDDVVAP